MPRLSPHPGCDILLFLSDRVGIYRGGAELRVPHPFLDHVERHPVHRGVNPEPVTQALRATVRRIRYPGLDHDPLDDLPDSDPAQVPNRGDSPLPGLLGLPDRMSDVESIEELGRYRDGPEHDLLLTRSVLAFLEAADRDGSTEEVDPGRGDLQGLRGAAPGPVQDLTQGPVPGGLAAGRGEEGRALFRVEIEASAGGVVEAHFGHSKQFT